MSIVALTAENVKRISAVHIEPSGALVIIGGKNGNGKSSTLDCIEYGLKGKGSIPSEPVRKGQKKARIVLETEEYKVTRTFTAKGGTHLVVENQKGVQQRSPQALLDKLVGDRFLDPLEFDRMKPKEQVEVLKGLVDFDFDEIEGQRQAAYDERTEVNRTVKSLKAQLEAIPEPDQDAVAVDPAELMLELERRQLRNQENANKREALSRVKARVDEIAQIMEQLEEEQDQRLEEMACLMAETDGLEDEDIDEVRQQIANVQDSNEAVRLAGEYHRIRIELGDAQEKSAGLSKNIEKFEKKKAKALKDADFPVEGLEFDEDGVRYADVPWDQCAQSERLRISTAMALAMNPELKVLLVRDGSLLDEDSLKIMADLAEEAGGQVFLERVGEGDECSVIIEDGKVKP